MLSKLMSSAPSEAEQTMVKLAIERICADMCDYYRGFYSIEGPGAMVYVPQAEEKDSMFYLDSDCLMNALNDFNSRDMSGPAEIMQKAIVRSETVDPKKEALFIIQDETHMALIHYKLDSDTGKFMAM
jgi:hypothetical protein